MPPSDTWTPPEDAVLVDEWTPPEDAAEAVPIDENTVMLPDGGYKRAGADGWKEVDVSQYAKAAEVLSRTPALGTGELAYAGQIPAEDRALFRNILERQYAADQTMKKAGYGQRLATSAIQGLVDYGTPLAKYAPGSPIPTLTPDQERYRQELMGVREEKDPTVRPDTFFLGRWAQQAVRMAFPQLAAQALAQPAKQIGGPAAEKLAVTLSFLPQVADQTYSSLIGEGVDPDAAWKITAISAPLEAAIESIEVNPARGFTKSAFRGTITQVVKRILWEATKGYTKELSEEGLQGIVNEAALEVGRMTDDEIPDKGLRNIAKRGLNEMKEAAGPLLLMMGPGNVYSATQNVRASAARKERLTQLKDIRAKGPVSRKDGRELGIKGNQEKRTEKVDKQIQTLEQEIQDASQVQQDEASAQVQGDAGQGGQVPGGGEVRGGREVEGGTEPKGEGAPARETEVRVGDLEVSPGLFRTYDKSTVPDNATSVNETRVRGERPYWEYRVPTEPTSTQQTPQQAPSLRQSIQEAQARGTTFENWSRGTAEGRRARSQYKNVKDLWDLVAQQTQQPQITLTEPATEVTPERRQAPAEITPPTTEPVELGGVTLRPPTQPPRTPQEAVSPSAEANRRATPLEMILERAAREESAAEFVEGFEEQAADTGITTHEVVENFFRHTYPNLSTEQRRQVDSQIPGVFGAKVGDVLYTTAEGGEIRAKSSEDIVKAALQEVPENFSEIAQEDWAKPYRLVLAQMELLNRAAGQSTQAKPAIEAPKPSQKPSESPQEAVSQPEAQKPAPAAPTQQEAAQAPEREARAKRKAEEQKIVDAAAEVDVDEVARQAKELGFDLGEEREPKSELSGDEREAAEAASRGEKPSYVVLQGFSVKHANTPQEALDIAKKEGGVAYEQYNRGKRPISQPKPAPEPTQPAAQSAAESITNALRGDRDFLDGGPPDMRQLRDQLGLTNEQFQEAVLQMRDEGKVHLSHIDRSPQDVPEDQRIVWDQTANDGKGAYVAYFSVRDAAAFAEAAEPEDKTAEPAPPATAPATEISPKPKKKGVRKEEPATGAATQAVEKYLQQVAEHGEAYVPPNINFNTREGIKRGLRDAGLEPHPDKLNYWRKAATAEPAPGPPVAAQSEKTPPAFRDWRFQSKTKNSGRIVPNRVGRKFTKEQLQSLVEWARSQGLDVLDVKDTGFKVVGKSGERLDLSMAGAAGVKAEQAEAESARRKAEEEARKQSQQERAAGRASAPWIASTFGEAINAFNRNALSDFVEGVTPKFEGGVSTQWREGLEKIGAVKDGGVDWKKVKAAYEASQQTEPTPEPEKKEPAKPPAKRRGRKDQETEAKAETPDADFEKEWEKVRGVLPKEVDLALDKQINRYEAQARKDEGGKGIAAGAENANYRWGADAVREFRNRVRKGMDPKQAAEEVKVLAREWIAKHNSRRPKDINWQRWEGAADSFIETAMRTVAQAAAVEKVESGPDVVIGEKAKPYDAGTNDDVQRWLKREQEKGKPAWFDGSHLYTVNGKYSVSKDEKGNPKLTKLHDLSRDGLIRWFDPSEYVSYNQAALEALDKQKADEAEKQRQREEKERLKKEAEAEERQQESEATAQIREYISNRKLSGKKGTIEIAVGAGKESVQGLRYGNLAVHKQGKKHKVTHIPTGLGLGQAFDTQAQAKEYVALISHFDWSFTNQKKMPEGLATFAFKAHRFVAGTASLEETRGVLATLKPESAPPAKPKTKKRSEQAAERGEGEGIAKTATATPVRQSRTAKRKTEGEQAGIAAADIQKTVERLFGVSVRQGGFSQRAAGIYKWLTKRKGPPGPEVVRTAEDHYANLAVLSHEVAHHVDETTRAVRGMPQAVRNEIKNLDYEPEKGRAFEGWAEFLRRYITEPPIDVAGTMVPNPGLDAPQTLAWFEGTYLPANPETAKSIKEFREYSQKFANQSVFQRIGTLISDRRPQDLSFKERWLRKSRRKVHRLKTNFVDKFHTLEWIQEEAKQRGHKGIGIYDLTMAYFLSASSHATVAFEEGVRSLRTGKPIGKTSLWGLREHLETDGEYNDAVLYALARHTVFMAEAKPGYNTGMDVQDAEAWLSEVEAAGKSDRYEEFAKGLARFNNDLIGMLVDAGALPADQAKTMLDYYGGLNYFPLHRVQDAEKSMFSGAGVGFVNLGKAVPGRSAKGSGRQIIDPLDATVARAIRFYGRAIQARQAHTLAETLDPLAGGVGGMGGLMDRVDPRKKVTQGTINEILGTLVEEGVIEADDAKAMRIAAKILNPALGIPGQKSLEWFGERHGIEVDEDGEIDFDSLKAAAAQEPDALAVISLWRPDYTPSSQKRTVVIYDKQGNRIMYEMDPDLYATATGMDDLQFGPFVSVMREAARYFKTGAVGLSTGFGAANLLRDYWEIQGKAQHLKGLASLAKPPVMLKRYGAKKLAAPMKAAGQAVEKATAGTPVKMLGQYIAAKTSAMAGRAANNPLIRLYEEAGGKVYSVIGPDVRTRRMYRRRRIGKSTMSKLGISVSHPLETAEGALQAVQDVIAVSDAPPRLADAEAAIKAEGFEIREGKWYDVNSQKAVDQLPEHVRIKASLAMAEATINFKRVGSMGQYVESFVPFFNASIQATYRQYKQIKGLRSLGKKDVEGMRAKRYLIYLSALAATGILHWLLRHDDDDWREQDAYLRDGYWTWGKDGKTYVRIPKPRDTAIVSNLAENMLDAWYHDDARDTSDVVLRDFGGRLPTGGGFVRGAIETYVADYDYFRERDLTPEYMKDLPKEQQVTPYTSRASDAIGQFTGRYFGTSPIQVEHLLSSASGGLYRRLADLYDAEADGRLGPEHIPFIRGLVINRHQARSINDFYDALENLGIEAKREEADKGALSDETIRKQAELEGHAELMTAIRALESKVGKRRSFEYQPYIVGLARHALGYKELESDPNPLTDENAPEAIKKLARDYSMRAVNQAVEPLKEKDEYKDEETYETERRSRVRGRAKIKNLDLSHEEAQRFLLDYYKGDKSDNLYWEKFQALAELYGLDKDAARDELLGPMVRGVRTGDTDFKRWESEQKARWREEKKNKK